MVTYCYVTMVMKSTSCFLDTGACQLLSMWNDPTLGRALVSCYMSKKFLLNICSKVLHVKSFISYIHRLRSCACMLKILKKLLQSIIGVIDQCSSWQILHLVHVHKLFIQLK
jgi:hypothetical protein